MQRTNRRFVLTRRPTGYPVEEDFRLEEVAVPDPRHREVMVETSYLSVDPYMRGRIAGTASYAAAIEIGGVMGGGSVGRVVESRHPAHKEGDVVLGNFGWQEVVVTDGGGLRKVDPDLAPISTALGILGMPGMTAYFGLLEVGRPRPGDTVVVSAAAGAVGSAVGQIAKIMGCRVIGTAGSDEKVRYVRDELGFDEAFNYRAVEDYVSELRRACPGGIDVYFDNVGGPLTDAVFRLLNMQARVVICGQISQYNLEEPEMGPRLLGQLIGKRARVEGFIVSDFSQHYDRAMVKMAEWIRTGALTYREDIVEGFEQAPSAFISMLKGANIGKRVVKV